MNLLEILIVVGLVLQISTIGHLILLKNKINQFRVEYLKQKIRPKKWNEIES
jgi:hypothetical protein|tara:strand:+ start:3024 stop:3179 length:156 start_codon:yes stop_codon:yes gene_type:complete